MLCIWPPHCLIGTWGHAIVPPVAQALYEWEGEFNRVNFVAKGSNLFTEHYSAVRADVEDPDDVSTKLNVALIDMLTEADEILITGEALSHCVANSIRDVAKEFGDSQVSKFTLLEDTSSNVGGFEKLGQDFVKDLVKLDEYNRILVDAKNQRATMNDGTAGIWAAGDCTDGLYHQNNIAAGDAEARTRTTHSLTV